MDRLTIRNRDGSISQPTDLTWVEALDKLAAYEDTGLSPEEIKNLNSGIIPNHWSELFIAECEDRLIVLPCKVGDTVYAIRDERVYETPVIGFRSHEWKEGFHAVLLFDSRKTNGVYEYPIADFGKMVFLTREEAEKALEAQK